jgi:hypothetical protein
MDEKAEKFWKGENPKKSPEPKVSTPSPSPKPAKVNISGEKMRNGLAQLILTVVELLRDLMEKQAIRRIEAGSLTEDETERLGNTFMSLKEELKKLKEHFDLDDDDLNIDLGPLMVREDESRPGKTSAIEILDRLLGKGIVARGDIVISVADVDLISLNLGLLVASIDKAQELYGLKDVKTKMLEEEMSRLKDENARLKESS